MRIATRTAVVAASFCSVLLSHAVTAQRASGKEVYGSVTGHVSCADTNQPARLTSITLQAIPDTSPLRKGLDKASRVESQAYANLTMYKTHLDGSFQVPRVMPGRYYVIVQKPGYLSPVAQFTREEIELPNEETRTLIAATIPIVAVNAHENSNIDIRLARAATINGTIRYDDGTPASEMDVFLSRRGKDGKWSDTHTGQRSHTSDTGLYRVTGLPAGEYRLATRLEIDETIASAVFGGSRSTSSHTKYQLKMYLGDTFREKEAKIVKLNEGEESSGDDFTIPVAKLHTITGSLVDARSGRAINAGTVKLFTAEDNVEMASAKVDTEEPIFRFDFIPEGEYIVRVDDAREVTREIVVYPPGTVGDAEPKETLLHSYGRYEAPFLVQTDITSVTLPMPERDQKKQRAATAP